MTKEEKELTIKYLTEMQEEYIEGEGYERYPLPEYYALDMAIKALEQPTYDDCVSRAEVDKLINLYLRTPTIDDSIAFYEHFLDLPPVTPIHGTCKDCKYCIAYNCGYTCFKNHWNKISKESNYGGMGDFYCADFEKRGDKE